MKQYRKTFEKINKIQSDHMCTAIYSKIRTCWCLLFLWHRLMTSLCFLLGGFHVVIAVTRIALMIIWVAVVIRAVCVTSIRASSIFFIWVYPQIFIVEKDPSVLDSLVAEVRLVLVTNTRTQSADFRVSSFFFRQQFFKVRPWFVPSLAISRQELSACSSWSGCFAEDKLLSQVAPLQRVHVAPVCSLLGVLLLLEHIQDSRNKDVEKVSLQRFT